MDTFAPIYEQGVVYDRKGLWQAGPPLAKASTVQAFRYLFRSYTNRVAIVMVLGNTLLLRYWDFKGKQITNENASSDK